MYRFGIDSVCCTGTKEVEDFNFKKVVHESLSRVQGSVKKVIAHEKDLQYDAQEPRKLTTSLESLHTRHSVINKKCGHTVGNNEVRRLLTIDENCFIMDINKNTAVPSSEYVYVRVGKCVCMYV